MSRNYYRNPQQRRSDKIIFGVGVAAVGIILLLRQLGLFAFSLHFTWPVILIIIGILIGLKSRFYNNAWWILILIGAVNLTPEFTIMGRPSDELVWPLFIIVGGLIIAFKPRRARCLPRGAGSTFVTNTENTLNVDVTFGGRKEIVTSKEFRGGVISTTFGGVEINLMQADSSVQPMEIDVRVAFGGVEMLVPAHWEVIVEIQPSFGSVEDQRMVRTSNAGEEKKTLILRGSVSFGSVEIKSY
ncbi:LiaF transmembrane domain-containing protein [Chitinophagaceae bacterium MMS25-I14]